MSEEQWKPGIAYPPDDPRWPHNRPPHRLWVNKARTILVRLWPDGTLELASRGRPDDHWGPPMVLEEET